MSTMKLFLIACVICLAQINAFAPMTNKPAFARSQIKTERYNILDVMGSVMKNFGKKARASHILIESNRPPVIGITKIMRRLGKDFDV